SVAAGLSANLDAGNDLRVEALGLFAASAPIPRRYPTPTCPTPILTSSPARPKMPTKPLRICMDIGKVLGHYRVVEKIGAGGMGEVYRASDQRLGRDVALKILKPSLADDQDRLRRFEQEARSAAALNHPNIVAIYDIGMHDGGPYIVSELLEGQTLRQRL